MTKERKKVITVVIGILLVGLSGQLYNNYLDSLPQDYTVGEVIDIYKPAKGNTRAEFRYVLNNKEYKQSINNYGYEKVAKVGKRFLVEYPLNHEESGVLLFDDPVPDGVEAPPNGWAEKPVFKEK